jgi:hypothetical protein
MLKTKISAYTKLRTLVAGSMLVLTALPVVDAGVARAGGGGVSGPGSGTPLAGYTWSVDGSQHIAYIGPDGDIHELFDTRGTFHWADNDLTRASGAPAPQSGTPLAGYTWSIDDSQHVTYIASDGDIHELFDTRGTLRWADNDLTSAANT